jgi:hypothetical protein
VEVLDFSKVKLTYGEQVINKGVEHAAFSIGAGGGRDAGPDFKTVYKMFGPTTPGEFASQEGKKKKGVYCISWKDGLALTFPVDAPEGFSKMNFGSQTNVLDSSACGPASAMVAFQGGIHGKSWPLARGEIYTADLSDLPLSPSPMGRREGVPAEVNFARIQDRGRIELIRRDAPPFLLRLGETTQQDLLTELGPPDSMFKQDKSKAITRKRRTSSMSSRGRGMNLDRDRLSEGDGSDAWTDDDEEEDEQVVDEADDVEVGTWWNYFAHGLDVLVAQAHQLPAASPTATKNEDGIQNETIARNHLTATKICIHSNIPGSWQFNRHRRLRWSLDSWPLPQDREDDISTSITTAHEGQENSLTSERKFRDIRTHLRNVFHETYSTPLEETEQQQPQAFNRDWGENSALGNSVELLGGFEGGGAGGKKAGGGEASEYGRLGEVLVYGFPGLAFEVLKNGCVAWVQVW